MGSFFTYLLLNPHVNGNRIRLYQFWYVGVLLPLVRRSILWLLGGRAACPISHPRAREPRLYPWEELDFRTRLYCFNVSVRPVGAVSSAFDLKEPFCESLARLGLTSVVFNI